MSQVQTALDSHVVAVYPNHSSAEEAVRRLVKEGIAMKDVSIVGRDFQVQEELIGFVSARLHRRGGGGRGMGRRAVRTAVGGGVPGTAGRRAGGHRRAVVGGTAGRAGGCPRGRGLRCPVRGLDQPGRPQEPGRSSTRLRSRRANSSLSCAATPSRSSAPRRCCPRGRMRGWRCTKPSRLDCVAAETPWAGFAKGT